MSYIRNTFICVSFLLMGTGLQAQINQVGTVPAQLLVVRSLATAGVKLYSTTQNSLTLYNLDLSIYSTITYPALPLGYSYFGVLYITESTFDTDPSTIELMMLTVDPFSAEQIEDVIKQNGIFIATNAKGAIIAYAFAGSWKYFEQWEIFNFMVSRFPQLSFQGGAITTENSFQYGPICIDLRYRGTGLLNQLFEEMRIEFVKKYPISVTFINKVNEVSTKAHTKKLGWEVIDAFGFNGKEYIGLAFDMRKSVLG